MGLRTALLVVTVLLAGCVGNPGPAGTVTETKSNATNSTERTVVSNVNETKVVERALDAEKAYVASKLRNASCVESWDTYPIVMDREGTVVNQTTSGLYVDVQQPYAWGNEDIEADSASRATYLVTDNETQRVSGPEIDPC
ncbi:hypothetical protein IL252_15070 [Halomicrobium sp. IBSBa]|uniref:hypothetical protein n=1 Tax=Halomicrobium sp. IBSBa TaxID=2778916 RepID=UPI001ABF8C58|nr:hypothetical protein [Halomicrobium sp. IBSBa]MBO4249139.1 hypothetical protein [Halomicrobium sp. IBSBa]